MNTMQDIWGWFKNTVLNGLGVERDLMKLISDKDINRAKQLFQNRDEEVLHAIREYNPSEHDVMFRPNKPRKDKNPYITNKLPRSWQKYINIIAAHFLLAKPIIYTLNNPDKVNEDAFSKFKEFIEESRHHDYFRELKRLAGAETEAAMIYHLFNEDGSAKVRLQVISKSKGYILRPLFDQYEKLVAFAYGYTLKENGKNIEHFDIMLPTITFRCNKNNIGWDINTVANPTGKINVIYAKQEKEWEGAEQRIKRDEYLDSKSADSNDYTSDPIAVGTADAIQSITDPETSGKLIQINNKEGDFHYVDIPEASESKRDEKKILKESIHIDTLTPEISFVDISGSLKLSGEAMRRAMLLGYIKRDIRKETYGGLAKRDVNVIISIMANVTHIHMREELTNLKIKCSFAEPFDDDKNTEWTAIGNAYQDGIISLETAINLMGVANPQEELDRIREEKIIQNESAYLPIGID